MPYSIIKSDSLNAQVKSKPALKSKSIFYGSTLKTSAKEAKQMVRRWCRGLDLNLQKFSVIAQSLHEKKGNCGVDARNIALSLEYKYFYLCDNAQAMFLVCFPQLPLETKVIRLIYQERSFSKEKIDIRIESDGKVEETQSQKPN
jgi:hypothetical protein